MEAADTVELFDRRVGRMHESDKIIPLTPVDLLLLSARLFTTGLGKIQFKGGVQSNLIPAGQFPFEVFDEGTDAFLFGKSFDLFP